MKSGEVSSKSFSTPAGNAAEAPHRLNELHLRFWSRFYVFRDRCAMISSFAPVLFLESAGAE